MSNSHACAKVEHVKLDSKVYIRFWIANFRPSVRQRVLLQQFLSPCRHRLVGRPLDVSPPFGAVVAALMVRIAPIRTRQFLVYQFGVRLVCDVWGFLGDRLLRDRGRGGVGLVVVPRKHLVHLLCNRGIGVRDRLMDLFENS